MIVHTKTGGERTDLHHQNLMRAIRVGEPLKCDCDLGMYGVVVCSMGNDSYRRGKIVRWDAAKQRVT